MKRSFADRVLDFAEDCALTQRANAERMVHLEVDWVGDINGDCPPSCELCRIWRSCKRNDKAMSKVRKLLKKRLGDV